VGNVDDALMPLYACTDVLKLTNATHHLALANRVDG